MGQPTTVARPPPLRNFNPAIVAFFTVIAANTAVSNAGIGPSVFSSDVSRLYVHLSKDVETAKAVGKRHGKEVVYSINSEQMYKDGYKFYLSKNGVWLTKRVPVKYLMKEV